MHPFYPGSRILYLIFTGHILKIIKTTEAELNNNDGPRFHIRI